MFLTIATNMGHHLVKRTDAEITDIAERAGVAPRLVVCALANRPINADAFFRICAVTGFDPMTGDNIPTRAPGSFSFHLLGAAVRLKRMANKHDIRQGAKAARLSVTTMSRIENGTVVSIENVLKACEYIGAHPFASVANPTPQRPHKPYQRGVTA